MSKAAGAVVTGLAVVVLTPLMALMAMGEPPPPHEPSRTALADIPSDRLSAYRAAAAPCALPWEVLAAIGKVASDHGRSPSTAGSMGSLSALADGEADPLQETAAFLCAQGATDPARLPAALAALDPGADIAQLLAIAESYRTTDALSPTEPAPRAVDQ